MHLGLNAVPRDWPPPEEPRSVLGTATRRDGCGDWTRTTRSGTPCPTPSQRWPPSWVEQLSLPTAADTGRTFPIPDHARAFAVMPDMADLPGVVLGRNRCPVSAIAWAMVVPFLRITRPEDRGDVASAAGLTVRDRRPCCYARYNHADPWHWDHKAAFGKMCVSVSGRGLGDSEPLRKLSLRGDDVTR